MDAEIGIVGGGPAGARAGELLAARGVETVVWDPKVPWEKPCGGGLPASAFHLVPSLKELLPRAMEIDAVRFEASSSEEGFPVRLRRPMYVVPRRSLSRFQRERAEDAGVRWRAAEIGSVERTRRGWRVEERGGSVWSVRLLVGADGAASLVRRVAAPGFRVELAPTRVSYPEGTGPDPRTLLVQFFDEVDGYFWDFSRPDHRSVGAGTEPGTWTRPRLDGEIERYLGSRGAGSSEANPRAGAVIGTAARGHGSWEQLGGFDYALLGDAAGFADPATGEGIQNALRSAEILARSYDPVQGLRAYGASARRAMAREFQRSRVLRAVLFRAGLGRWLVRRGCRRAWARALVSGVMNCTNEHDLSLPGLVRRSATALVT